MISVTGPISPSFEWTKKVLFRPFSFHKWVVLGFCAFLASLAQGGGTNVRLPSNLMRGSSQTPGQGFDEIGSWVSAHLPLVIGLSLVIVGFALALGLLMMWLSSRGMFMFLDGVVNDRGEVVEPWRRFRALGNSLFVFRLLLGFGGLAVILVILLLGWLIARPDIAAREFGASALAAVLVGGLLFLMAVVALAVVGLLLEDFVVPIMYRRGLPAAESFGVLWREVLPGFGWTFVLFYLMKFVLGLAAGIIILLGTCLTCCLAGLPYVSSVVFLPVFVFFRAYSLYFLEQFGEEWRMIGIPEETAATEEPR